MSTEINLQTIELDPAASAFLAAYVEAKVKIKEWQERADMAAEQIKAAMGNHEVALVDGSPAVRWTTVESRAIDVKKCREILPPQVLDLVEIVRTSKRFVLVGEGE
jgi:predicted phage-related endonuclease